MITPEIVRAFNPRLRFVDAQVTAQKLWAACQKYDITTRLRIAALLAQLAHESGLAPITENLNYSAERLRQVWPGRFPTLAAALPYAHNPERLANLVYAGRIGNGPPASGDGWRFRGRGMIQLTGRANYRTYGKLTGFDLETHPELLEQIGVSCLVACAYWHSRGLNALADRGDINGISRAINGGNVGLRDRAELYQRALKLLTPGS